ncbi:coatomer subunit zeta-2 isoform X2 [Rissa tridactyla]|uniref:coatomer subunit zeta-2 isoform X2 n=1 Tax=Rissa tridactyla TaxID=75485 RepID=UPI0023BA7F36|nr:coatomer subunit zeta-2 isoform X2 [Rissa tridactyla]
MEPAGPVRDRGSAPPSGTSCDRGWGALPVHCEGPAHLGQPWPTSPGQGEVACLEGLTVVYRSSADLFFYVVGGCQENELMLSAVLACLLDTLGHLLQKEVEKRLLLDNMEGTFLVVDEIVDRGVILESDPQQVIQRLSLRGPEPAAYGFVLFDYLAGGSEQRDTRDAGSRK